MSLLCLSLGITTPMRNQDLANLSLTSQSSDFIAASGASSKHVLSWGMATGSRYAEDFLYRFYEWKIRSVQ